MPAAHELTGSDPRVRYRRWQSSREPTLMAAISSGISLPAARLKRCRSNDRLRDRVSILWPSDDGVHRRRRVPETEAREGGLEVGVGRRWRDFGPDDIEKPGPAFARTEDSLPLLVREVHFDGVGVVFEVGKLDERTRKRPPTI